jgi:hypothetical protein
VTVVGCDGASVRVIDVEVCGDRQQMAALEHGEAHLRAYTCNTGGDGDFEVRGERDGSGELVRIFVACDA